MPAVVNASKGIMEWHSEQDRAAAADAAPAAADRLAGVAGVAGVGDGGGWGQGVDKNAGSDIDSPPASIMHAAYVGALELVKSMVEVGMPADAPDTLRGSTPLHWASYGGHLHVVRWLVKTAGANPNKANSDGCTPLFFACERGHLGVAQWLVREAGAEVNVKDNVMWQTPLHRVCLNARADGAAVSEMEDLILWLVEAGADLTAVDRFGNHVEDLRSNITPKNLASTGSGSKLCDMISSAREDGVPEDETREKLKRRGAVRKRSASENVVQLSPKLEAKQRAPMSRRGNRKAAGGNGSGTSSGTGSPSNLHGERNLRRSGSYGSTHSSGGEKGLQRKRSSGSSKGGPKPVIDWSEHAAESLMIPQRDLGSSSGGGVAAPPAGAGARMGGGPPAPAVAREEPYQLSSSKSSMGIASKSEHQRQPKHQHKSKHCRSGTNDLRRSRRQPVGGNGTSTKDEELQQQESLRVAEEALKTTEASDPPGDAVAVGARRRLDGAGQQVVDKIRQLTAERKSGAISDHEFANLKRQLLEMEQLRREAEEEARRREEGYGEDTGAGILTSVGQNTPPPSPKKRGDNGDRTDDDDDDQDHDDHHNDDAPIQILAPTAVKDVRETYKASDIERYTSNQPDGPRVFGEVPESVKESLAAKEAAKEAIRQAAAKEGKGDDKKLKGKKKSGPIPVKDGNGGDGETRTGLRNEAGLRVGAAERGDASGSSVGGLSGHIGDVVPSNSAGGCKCAIM